MATLQRSGLLLATGAFALLTTTGCAYFNGVLPSAGIDTGIYDATGNILVQKKIPVRVFPECVLESDGATQTCKGTTMDGKQILATGNQSETELPFTLKVGGVVIFNGSAKEVLAQSAVHQ